MGRILLISDTHMPRMAKRMPPPLEEALEQAEFVLHAGDIVTREALRAFEAFAPVVAVAGNNDGEAAGLDAGLDALPRHRLLSWHGWRIGLTHGHEGRGRTTPDRAFSTFQPHEVDAVVFGHSHIPLVERRGGCLLVNPGSPTDRRRQPDYSFAWLTSGARLEAQVVRYASKT